MADKPNLKYVRTQVSPDTHDRARFVAGRLDWNVPAVYTACADYCMWVIGPEKFAALVEEQLARAAGKESE